MPQWDARSQFCQRKMLVMTERAPDSIAIDVGARKAEKGGNDVAIDVAEGEEACRICHLMREAGEGKNGSEMIRIGCGCKGELGFAHRDCGEAWFRTKGDRYCEICGMHAKNINGEDNSRFMEEWHEGRTMEVDGAMTAQLTQAEGGCCWRNRAFCHLLLGCLVVTFIISWLFRSFSG